LSENNQGGEGIIIKKNACTLECLNTTEKTALSSGAAKQWGYNIEIISLP
jgi:hypothetical protein